MAALLMHIGRPEPGRSRGLLGAADPELPLAPPAGAGGGGPSPLDAGPAFPGGPCAAFAGVACAASLSARAPGRAGGAMGLAISSTTTRSSESSELAAPPTGSANCGLGDSGLGEPISTASAVGSEGVSSKLPPRTPPMTTSPVTAPCAWTAPSRTMVPSLKITRFPSYVTVTLLSTTSPMMTQWPELSPQEPTAADWSWTTVSIERDPNTGCRKCPL
mmetsp:Transcript_11720/g.35351  ORF Transcript_11720/g.35351 Transcript_11720/m.35351 type:complete len:218 (-) Transcript_11720:447-1100(-)